MDAVKDARFSEAAKALTKIEQIESPSIYGDSIEMLHEVKIEAARMKKDLEQSIEKHATKQELLANSESASAEALYNAAHEILNSDAGPEAVKEAIRYLELAAAKGLALARKRLAGVLPD